MGLQKSKYKLEEPNKQTILLVPVTTKTLSLSLSLHFWVISWMATTTATTALGASSSGYPFFSFYISRFYFLIHNSFFLMFTLGQVCLFPSKKNHWWWKKINGFSERSKQAEPGKVSPFFSLGIMSLYMGYVIVETLECFVWFSIHGFMSGSFLLFYLFIFLWKS